MEITPPSQVEQRIARRLAQLRAERGLSLEALAQQTGLSRATLSRIERNELSPTAAMLARLCAVFGWTLSRFMADTDTRPPNLLPSDSHARWTDADSGYSRIMVSPPSPDLRGEMVDVRLPAGAAVSFDASPVPDLEHHLLMLAGTLHLDIDGTAFQLRTGDCLRYVLNGPTRFHNPGRRETRYVLAMVRP